jgi:glycosyltransferase involved in cell wall biosynthesis
VSKVAVIIPTYNRAADLRRALRSVLGQTLSDFECIVVDNHSTDDTDAAVAEFADPRVRLLKIHNNGSVAASRNLGLQQADSDLVAFLDSDDWWMPEKLALSVRALDAGADLVYHDLYLVGGENDRRWRRSPTRVLHAPVFEDLLSEGNGINLSSVVVRRRLLLEAGGFSEDSAIIAAEDFDAWLRVARRSDGFTRIPRTLGFYLVAPGSLSSPARTLSVLDEIERRYFAELAAIRERRVVYWLPYARARANYSLRRFAEARRHLASIRWRHAPLHYHARRVITKLQMLFGSGAGPA